MRKENLDNARLLVEKINGIDNLIKDIKESTKWGFTTKTLNIFSVKKQPGGYSILHPYDYNTYFDNSNDKISIYSIDNEAFKTDLLELLEKHKSLMEEVLAEL